MLFRSGMEESQDTVVNVAKKERRPVRAREGRGQGTEHKNRRERKISEGEERGIEGKRDDVYSIFKWRDIGKEDDDSRPLTFLHGEEHRAGVSRLLEELRQPRQELVGKRVTHHHNPCTLPPSLPQVSYTELQWTKPTASLSRSTMLDLNAAVTSTAESAFRVNSTHFSPSFHSARRGVSTSTETS